MIYLCERKVYLKSDLVVPAFVYMMGAGDPLPFPDLPAKRQFTTLKKGKHRRVYYNLYCGFDIETTNLITDDSKLAFMYIWQFVIASEKKAYVFLGRTWQDFTYLLQEIANYYQISESERVIIWIANMSFEFQFMRHHIEWNTERFQFFAKEERKPFLATCHDGIEFRDCLAISGGSLKQLAKDYCTTQKLDGDLDYKIMRNSKTELTREELAYCINDVIILAEWSRFAFDTWIKPNKKVPLTKTGLLRLECKNELAKRVKNRTDYDTLIASAFPDEATYYQWFNYLFRGGFVHANFYYANTEMHDVLMYDITSSYPAEMNRIGYPVTPFKEEPFNDRLVKEKCCILVCDFYDIEAVSYHSIESKHKLLAYDNVKIDNGRVYKADYIRVMLTELDYQNYLLFYKWRKMNVISCKTSKCGRLPAFIVDVLNRHYGEKAKLKRAGLNDTPKYAIVKSGVNAAFGLMVTKLALDEITYTDDWHREDLALDYKEEIKRLYLLPQWGIYVAALARHELLKMVYRIEQVVPNAVIYCDTDSIKCINDPKIKEVINTYNAEMSAEIKASGLTSDLFSDLGQFELEYKKPVDKFKTIGAKRYLYEVNGKIKATIAGLPKDAIINAFNDPFEHFDIDGMKLPCELSDKLTTCYNDEPTSAIIDGEEMHELSSVALYDIPFSMFTDKDYYELIITGALQERKTFDQ